MLTEKLYSVLLVSSSDKVTEYMTQQLSVSNQFAPIDTTRTCGDARRLLLEASYDIVIVNTPAMDEFGTNLALDIVQDSMSAVILLVKNELYEEISYKVEGCGVFTVSKPTSQTIMNNAIKLAAATRSRLKKAESKNEKLAAKVDEIRIVNRAKWILIKHLNMSEENAHRYIEKQAMDMRMTKREIAENIIKTYES